MKDMDLGQIMRSGLAGGVFFCSLLVAFDVPGGMLSSADSGVLDSAVLIALALLVGTLIYSLHRAIPYPLLKKLMLFCTRQETDSIKSDIERWQLRGRTGSLLPKFDEWAHQIHFLYCTSWAGLIAVAVGFTWFEANRYWAGVLIGSLVLFLVAALHQWRCQCLENRILELERSAASEEGTSWLPRCSARLTHFHCVPRFTTLERGAERRTDAHTRTRP